MWVLPDDYHGPLPVMISTGESRWYPQDQTVYSPYNAIAATATIANIVCLCCCYRYCYILIYSAGSAWHVTLGSMSLPPQNWWNRNGSAWHVTLISQCHLFQQESLHVAMPQPVGPPGVGLPSEKCEIGSTCWVLCSLKWGADTDLCQDWLCRPEAAFAASPFLIDGMW